MESDVERAVRDPDRLARLRGLHILDEPSELEFESLAEVARQSLNVPIVLISLVDEHRQFFISCPGLPEPWATRRETPLTHSFCKFAVESREPLVVSDARTDARFQNNPAIADLGVIAYAGYPLITSDGTALGTVCAISGRPRTWEHRDINILQHLARCVVTRIELRAALREITVQERETTLARRFAESIIRSVPGIFYVLDSDGRMLSWNENLEELTGYAADQIAGMHAVDLIVEDERPIADARFRQVLEDGRAEGMGNLRGGDGRPVPFHFTGVRLTVAGEVRIIGIGTDLSEQQRAEEERRVTESQYRDIVEHALFGIYRVSLDGRILAANPAFVAMLGYDSEEQVRALDLARDVYADPDDRAAVLEAFHSGDAIHDLDVRWKRRDGEILNVRITSRRLRGAAGEPIGFESFVEDITEHKQLEDQVRQAQKMEAVGRLAGGVAHDFNNLLTVITAEAELLLEDLAHDAPERASVLETRKAAERGAQLTQQLLAFARRRPASPRPLNVDAMIGDMQRMLARLLGETIDLRLDLHAPDLLIHMDPVQLQQVLVNLTVNARDAMPLGGLLTIETARAGPGVGTVQAHAPARIRIAVIDSGVGMTDDVRSRAFEPFFTTKPVGQGTGLGLSTCYGIVREAGGTIEIVSGSGRGTMVHVFLPATIADLAAPAGPRVRSATERGGSETVLLVEDAAEVRRVTARILRGLGYRVIEAADAKEAIEQAARHIAEIEMLVTDIVLPGLDGVSLAEQLQEAHPGMPVLFLSGYADEDRLQRIRRRPNSAFLPKPFATTDLAQHVRALLDARPTH